MTELCSVEGCERPMLKKCGLCNMHYIRKRRHGDPLAGGAHRTPLPEKCQIEGCEKRAFASEMCSMHYARNRKHGSPFKGAHPGKGVCSVEGCGKPNASHNLCPAHLMRLLRHGDVNHGGEVVMKAKVGEPLQWLLAHVDHKGDSCLTWPYSRDSAGYGGILYEGRDDRPHRVMCRLVHGEPPSHEQNLAAHSCGNGHLGCVNPNHLRWATFVENMEDKRLHGTHGRKLTEAKVRAIRCLALDAEETAEIFGVTAETVEHVRSRKTWTHI